MSPLITKFWRDLKSNYGQFLAVAVVIALGISFFIASFSSYQSVQNSLAQTYQELKFPRYWLKIAGDGPATLPVNTEMRQVAEVTLEFKQAEKTGAKVIGIPPGGPLYNQLKLQTGSFPGDGQVLVEASFAKVHGLKLGDPIIIRTPEKVYQWVVSGTVGSPEFIWPLVDRFTPNPSPRAYGVLYVAEKQLIRDLTPISHEIVADTDNLRELMTSLQSQGVKVTEIYSRAQQPSNQVLTLMLNGYAKIAGILPWIFLLAAAMASYALTYVMVKTQKEQILTLYYLGFTRWQVVVHFTSFGIFAGLAGSAAGSVLGILLAQKLAGTLAGLIGLPFVVSSVQSEIVITGIILCLIAAALGAVAPALSPKITAELPSSKIIVWQRILPVMLRQPVNNILRDKRNAVYRVAVSTLGIGLVTVGLLLYQSVGESTQKQNTIYQAYDLKVQFRTALKEEVASDLFELDGITDVNPFLEAPITVKYRNQELPTLMVGMRGDMLRLQDRLGRVVQPTGLLLPESLRQALKAKWIPRVTVTTPGGRKVELPVKSYVQWHIGNQVFAPLETAQSLSGTPGINGAFLRVVPEQLEQVRATLYKYPTVLRVDSPQENLSDQKTLLAFSFTYLRILLVFGVILAAAMIFATARINVLARSREFITMRILGLGMGKIGLSIIGEYVLVLVCGLAGGLAAGTLLAYVLLRQVNSVMFFNVLTVHRDTLGLIVVISLLIIPLAVISALNAIRHLNLAENTKEQN